MRAVTQQQPQTAFLPQYPPPHSGLDGTATRNSSERYFNFVKQLGLLVFCLLVLLILLALGKGIYWGVTKFLTLVRIVAEYAVMIWDMILKLIERMRD
jgi:hypothetical protein